MEKSQNKTMSFKKLNHDPSVPEKLQFVVSGITRSHLNSLRRIMLSGIQTKSFAENMNVNVGIYTKEETKTSKQVDSIISYPSINVIENCSALNNEFLSHRISLIPVGFNDEILPESDLDESYVFVLKKHIRVNNKLQMKKKKEKKKKKILHQKKIRMKKLEGMKQVLKRKRGKMKMKNQIK